MSRRLSLVHSQCEVSESQDQLFYHRAASNQAPPAETKFIDSELSRAAFVLEPIGPLSYQPSKLDSDQGLSSEELGKALRESITLLGNDSSHISKMRRKRVLKTLNPKMQDMADEQQLFWCIHPTPLRK